MTTERERGTFPLPGMIGLVLVGTILGVAYNAIGLKSKPAWGLAWKGEDRLEVLADNEVQEWDGSEQAQQDAVSSSDPLHGVTFGNAAANLPEIVNVGRPSSVGASVVKAFVDQADSALIIDAREPEEFADGHIPGAVNMPYDQIVSDPARIEAIENEGKPIIIYCGGPECEISKNLALDFYYAGLEPIAYYEGGLPEWEERGYALTTGGGE